MRFSRVLGIGFALAPIAFSIGIGSARAEDRKVVPFGGGLPPMSIEVNLQARTIKARTCPSGSPCNGPERTIEIDLAKEDLPNEAAVKIDVIAIGDSKRVAHVKIPSAHDPERAFEAVIAANEGPPIFAGITGLSSERGGTIVTTADRGDGTRSIVVGKLESSVRICGQKTPLEPMGLDPKTLELRRATLRLPKDVRDKAQPAVAARAAESTPLPLVSPLSFVATSGGKGGALTDGDPATTWIETRPHDGRGEFVTLRAAAGVTVTRLRFVVAPATLPEGYAAPRELFVVTNEDAFAVTMPEDAALHPGAAYDVTLPKAIATECVSIVLDESYAKDNKTPNVGVAEVYGYTELDVPGMTLDDLALKLRGGGEGARVASSLLGRAGKNGLSAIERVYPKLDADGRRAALDAAAGASCEDASMILANALTDRDAKVALHAQDRVERCGKRAGPALVAALVARPDDAPDEPRLEETLATVAPDLALAPLSARLGKKSGAASATARKAFAIASRNVAPEKLSEIAAKLSSPAAKLDFFRAIAPRAAELDDPSKAALMELATDASFDVRWLVAPAIGSLAAADLLPARATLERWLSSEPSWPLRARAAEVMPATQSGTQSLVKACTDESPRVREAVLLRARDPKLGALAPCAGSLVTRDPWPFIRVAAANDLAVFPADNAWSESLVVALRDPVVDVRIAALRALGARHATAHARFIQQRFVDQKEDREVRRAAARALGQVCATTALDDLTRVAKDAAMPDGVGADVDLGMAAVEALGMIHPSDLRARIAPALDPRAPSRGRAAASRALADPGTCNPQKPVTP